MKKTIFAYFDTLMYIWTKKIILFFNFFFGQMTANTNQGYFSVELGLFYYILKKKYCVFEIGPKNIDFKIKVFFGFFLTIFCRLL
jgi:hypothetical protein